MGTYTHRMRCSDKDVQTGFSVAGATSARKILEVTRDIKWHMQGTIRTTGNEATEFAFAY